jgi:hypothetical protein
MIRCGAWFGDFCRILRQRTWLNSETACRFDETKSVSAELRVRVRRAPRSAAIVYAQRVPQTVPGFPHDTTATCKNGSGRHVELPMNRILNAMTRNVFRAGGTNAPLTRGFHP